MKCYVYLLQSEQDGGFYIGQTQNVVRRPAQHNEGKVKSTCCRRPLKLIGYEEHETRSDARFREYEMKRHSDKKRQFVDRITGVLR